MVVQELAVFQHRPTIELLAPPEIMGGQETRATVRLHAKRAVDVRGLTIVLSGTERALFGARDSASWETWKHPPIKVRLLGPCRLVAGTHEYDLTIRIPKLSPTYRGRRCSTRHLLKLSLALPWWFDRAVSYELVVGAGEPLAEYPGNATLFASTATGPSAKKAYVEGSVARDVVAPGGLLSGAVALSNIAYLVGYELLTKPGRREEYEVRRLSLEIPTRDPAEGESFPIGLQLPSDLAPTAIAHLWTLRWELEVVAQVRMGRDVAMRLPVTVVPRRFTVAAGLATDRPVPSVGSARVRALWHEVWREHRGRRGYSMVGELHYGSLRIGASIEQVSLLATGFRGGLRGHTRWQRHHELKAREANQGEVLFAALGVSLAHFPQVRLDDESTCVELSDSGSRRRRLQEFVGALVTLADAIGEVREQMPLPEVYRDRAEEWRQFAELLGGTVEPGDMSIQGCYQGIQISTTSTWSGDGQLQESCISAIALPRVASEDCFEINASHECIGASDFLGVPDDRRSLFERAGIGARRLSWEEDRLELAFAPQASPAIYRERLSVIAALANTRIIGAGPYR